MGMRRWLPSGVISTVSREVSRMTLPVKGTPLRPGANARRVACAECKHAGQVSFSERICETQTERDAGHASDAQHRADQGGSVHYLAGRDQHPHAGQQSKTDDTLPRLEASSDRPIGSQPAVMVSGPASFQRRN